MVICMLSSGTVSTDGIILDKKNYEFGRYDRYSGRPRAKLKKYIKTYEWVVRRENIILIIEKRWMIQ